MCTLPCGHGALCQAGWALGLTLMIDQGGSANVLRMKLGMPPEPVEEE